MAEDTTEVSEKVIYTVSEVINKDPTEMPPLERTISADALDALFHEANPLPGAYTVFPYCDVWVMIHSDKTVDVFKEYATTSADEDLPEKIEEPTADERMVMLHTEDERYSVHEDELDTLQEVVAEANDCREAWEESIEYARES